jgi:hypothetical protein
MNAEIIKHIDNLAHMQHLFRPQSFRSTLAEALVFFFYKQGATQTEILNSTNKVLASMEVEEVSLGFVRHALKDR